MEEHYGISLQSLRQRLADTTVAIQWCGQLRGQCYVRLGTETGYEIVKFDLHASIPLTSALAPVPNLDVDEEDHHYLPFPPDTTEFSGPRAMSILGVNIGGDCTTGCAKEYKPVQGCVCAYDIETSMEDCVAGGMSLKDGKILSIAAQCSCGAEFFVSSLGDSVSSSSMCGMFIKFVFDHRPLWLIGWNCFTFDNMWIQFHAEPEVREYTIVCKSGLTQSEEEACILNVPGVYNVDAYVYMARSRSGQYPSFRLADIAKKLGCSPKLEMPKMSQDTDAGVLKLYNMNDCKVTLEVWGKSELGAEIPSLSVCTCSHVYDSCRYLTGTLMPSACASEALDLGMMLDWGKCRQEQDYRGGLVLEPVKGVYDNVGVYDFKSMYPSVMVACNISPDTIVSKRPLLDKDVDLPDYKRTQGGHAVKLEGHVVEFEEGKFSIPCHVMKMMVRRRQEVRKSNPIYGAVLKVGANSLYGALGYEHSSMYSPSCSSAITTVSRFCLRTAVEVCDSRGLSVVYGDTDSVFITHPDFHTASEMGVEELVRQRLESLGIRGVIVERENTYSRLIMMSKKRYCATTGEGKTKLTGISAVRKDSYGIVRESSKGLALALLSCDRKVVNYVLAAYAEEVLNRLAQRDLTLYEASRFTRKAGIRGFHYVDNLLNLVSVPADEAQLQSIVACDKGTIATSLGKEFERFCGACRTGTLSETIRDYSSL